MAGKNWQEYSVFILEELKHARTEIKQIKEAVTEIRINVAIAKVKHSFWGAIGGTASVFIILLVKSLIHK